MAKQPKEKRRRKRGGLIDVLNAILTLVIIGMVVAIAGLLFAANQFYAPGVVKADTAFTVERGSSISTVAARLEEQGLIERHCCSQDKRARIVTLTPAGKALLDQIEGRIIAVRRELLTGISQQELAQFEDIVHRISANALGKIATQHEERE